MNKTWEKGQDVEILLHDMSVDGQGIGRLDGSEREPGPKEAARLEETTETAVSAKGLVVFVSGGVKGDRVRARLTKVKKNMAFGRVEEILEPSPLRNGEFDCPGSAGGCGGCPLGQLDYEAQLEMKEAQIGNRLTRIGGLVDPLVRPIIGMEDSDNGDQGCWRYRNKGSFPVSTGGVITRKGGIVENLGDPSVGFYRGGSHEVVDCPDCYLQSMAAVAAADALRRFMTEDNITGFDPRWNIGMMRDLTVKTAFGTGEVMVILGINGKGIPGVQKLISMLDEAIYETGYSLESVVLRIRTAASGGQKGKGSREKETYETIAGKPVITETMGGLTFEISPASFFQVNPAQMKRLYDVVREYCVREDAPEGERSDECAPAGKKPVILDLYCGVGSIGLYCADLAEAVIGIESVREAVTDANRNAVINGIVNARYLCGRAEEILPSVTGGTGKKNGGRADEKDGKIAGPSIDPEVAERIRRADIAILDPPRAGCRPQTLEAVAAAGVSRIIYVSCDPATLARDISILEELGYAFAEATPVDMFPHTGHVEAVSLLQKMSNTRERTITLDVEMEDYHRIKNEGR